ncbi:MAG: 3-phosphoshikimate 1-carboxyvinyltransferase [Chloroflexi bacterium]|nr:3-phosphoshikimate 1-carboxyvinyltransferase [Chloroflexota bacterium]
MIKKINRPSALEGQIRPPGDKSIGHRAVMLNGISEGKAHITNFCAGGDTLATISCMKAMGVKVRRPAPDTIDVVGVGASGLKEPQDVLNARNSGTTTRLLSGILAGQPFVSIITGDASLRSRPMARATEPLRKMGADIIGRDNGRFAPLVIRGGKLHGIRYELPVASAQVKSAIILAGLFAEGETCIVEPGPTRDHTERILAGMGAAVRTSGRTITVSRIAGRLNPLSFTVPGDISAAAYWMVAAAIHPKATVDISGCGINPTRTGVIDILRSMGTRIVVRPADGTASEPTGDITISSSELHGTEARGDLVVRSIDEVPVLAVAACFARGVTTIRDAQELKVKETDRIVHTIQELSKMGARIDELPDGMVIHGVGRLHGAEVESHGDHRLAMSLAVAGLAAEGDTIIKGAEIASVSYPSFWSDLEKLSTTFESGRR